MSSNKDKEIIVKEKTNQEIKSIKDKSANSMRDIYVDKVVVNMGVGEGGNELENAANILKMITKKPVVKTICKVKLPTWNIRPGLPIGVKTTLRGKDALNFIDLTLKAKQYKINKKSFGKDGNFSYGIHEYLDIPGVKYNPAWGIKGFDVCVCLRRKGYRTKLRKYKTTKVGKKHNITREEAMKFAQDKLKVVVE